MSTVLIADCRTGSHLLARTLAQHPELSVSGEVFSTHHGRSPPPWEPTLEMLLAEYDLVHVQRYQIPAGGMPAVNRADRAISLIRLDLLAQYRSLRTAEATDYWRSDHQRPRDDLMVYLRFRASEFDRWAADTLRRRAAFLPTIPTLHLTFEGLTSDFAGNLRNVQTFLGVRQIPLAAATEPTPRWGHVCYDGWPRKSK